MVSWIVIVYVSEQLQGVRDNVYSWVRFLYNVYKTLICVTDVEVGETWWPKDLWHYIFIYLSFLISFLFFFRVCGRIPWEIVTYLGSFVFNQNPYSTEEFGSLKLR